MACTLSKDGCQSCGYFHLNEVILQGGGEPQTWLTFKTSIFLNKSWIQVIYTLKSWITYGKLRPNLLLQGLSSFLVTDLSFFQPSLFILVLKLQSSICVNLYSDEQSCEDLWGPERGSSWIYLYSFIHISWDTVVILISARQLGQEVPENHISASALGSHEEAFIPRF